MAQFKSIYERHYYICNNEIRNNISSYFQSFHSIFAHSGSCSIIPDRKGKWQVDIGNYPSGVYLVKYITDDIKWGAEKIILVR